MLPSPLPYPEDLPITGRKQDVLAALDANQVVIVAGETGSGKSTQLPKMCLEAGRGSAGMIGHTQPRRIAARSIAERVAEELMQVACGDDMEARNAIMRRAMMTDGGGIEETPLE